MGLKKEKKRKEIQNRFSFNEFVGAIPSFKKCVKGERRREKGEGRKEKC
jgi:hypothetical protein